MVGSFPHHTVVDLRLYEMYPTPIYIYLTIKTKFA